MCMECGQMFADQSTLRNHRLTHSGEKPLQCDICSKTFLWPNRLRSHKLTHAEFYPYMCTSCHVKLRTKAQVKKHCIKYHSTNFIIQSCDLCLYLCSILVCHTYAASVVTRIKITLRLNRFAHFIIIITH